MSGGALDYLCFKDWISTHDLGHIEMALERLEKIPECVGTKAHYDLITLRDNLKNAQSKYEKLNAVLHDIEWVMSGDWIDEDLVKTIKEYENDIG